MTTDHTGAGAKSQLDKFKEAAHALECDEDEASWDERLKRVAKQKSGERVDARK